MPRVAGLGDHKAFGGNNKREAKQLLKENKMKEVQLTKYPQIHASKSKYLFFDEGPKVSLKVCGNIPAKVSRRFFQNKF